MSLNERMSVKEKKTIFMYLLLISTIVPPSYGQLGFNNGVAGHTATTFKQTHSNFYYPNAGSQVYPHPAAKGYLPVSGVNSYNSYPVNGQYWTGQPYHHTNYHQYPQYQNHGYLNYPGYNQYYPQQYGYVNQMSGYNNYYGQYPNFDAQYWTGNNYYPSHTAQMYVHPAAYYTHPVPFYHKPMYYQGHRMMYNNHYPYHAVHYQPSYYGNQYDRGFLGGTGGQLAKGLLGALLVGAVAGTVARRG